MATIFFEIALTLYFASMIAGIFEIFKGSKATFAAMLSAAALGFLFHAAGILYRYFNAGHLPIASAHEATSFFAFCTVFIFFILELRYKVGLLGSFIMPIVFVLMLVASVFSREIKPLAPVLQSNWLLFHTVFAFFANAAFAIASGVAVMYLVQEHFVRAKRPGDLFQRLPSLQSLDEINYRLITVGFPLFTLAIVTGVFWADTAWGSYWRWDPREVWSLITWFIFAIILHARFVAGWRGKRAAVLTVIGFSTILIAFFGIKLLKKGLHVFL
jgi:cytochrome c-type biogenesis protein CcsB